MLLATGGYELLGMFRRLPFDAAARALRRLVPIPPQPLVIAHNLVDHRVIDVLHNANTHVDPCSVLRFSHSLEN